MFQFGTRKVVLSDIIRQNYIILIITTVYISLTPNKTSIFGLYQARLIAHVMVANFGFHPNVDFNWKTTRNVVVPKKTATFLKLHYSFQDLDVCIEAVFGSTYREHLICQKHVSN